MEAEWHNADGCLFHATKLCDMEWGREATRRRRKRSRDVRAMAAFGGPIAELAFDDELDEAASLDASGHTDNEVGQAEADWDGELRVFSSTGRLIWKKMWLEGPVAQGGMGWVRGGLLVCLLEAGDSALVFRGDAGAPPRIISLPSKGRNRIACAHVWAGGFVAVTDDLEVIEGVHLQSASKYRVRVRAQLSPVLLGGAVPHVVTVLRPFVSREEPELAQFAIGNPTRAGVVIIESDGTMRSQFALALDLAVSQLLVPHPTYRLLASFGADGELALLPLDFCQVLVRHSCKDELGSSAMSRSAFGPPDLVPCSLLWCGMSTFALCALWSFDAPWTAPGHSGMLVLSVEHKFALLSRAHLKGSDALAGEGAPSAGGGEGAEAPLRTVRMSFHGVCGAFFEVDGVRVVGSRETHIVRQVPECFQSSFRLGSTEPSAMLLDAVDLLDGGDAEADASLRALVKANVVEEAVRCCLEAAEHATCVEGARTGAEGTQAHLLRVAAYGKRFLPLAAAGRASRNARRRLARRFVETCQLCRLCALARAQAGVALTTKQLRIMTPRVFVDRLLYQGEFALAARICKSARVPLSHVVAHWTKAKISASGGTAEDDNALLAAITARVEACQREHGAAVSFASVAAVAAAVGKADLAVRLGEKERKLSRRILLLLKVQDYEGALRALHGDLGLGADPDLHCFVASDCVLGLPWDRIVQLCKQSGATFALLSRYLRSTDKTQYKQLLLALDKKRDKAMVLAEESSASLDASRRSSLLLEAASEFKDAGQRALADLAAEHARLLERQNQLGDSVVGLSLANTVLDCFRRGLDGEAEAFASDFGLRERSFRKIQLRGLAARKAWARIQDLSYMQAVRNVLDDADFAEVCIAGGQTEAATRYVEQMDDGHERKASMLLALGLFEQAIDAAYKVGNTAVLDAVRRRRADLASEVVGKLELLAADGPPIKPKHGAKERPALLHVAKETCAQQ